MAIRLPEEHGAWGILLVPLISSALVARGNWSSFFLLLSCVLGLFVLRGCFQRMQDWRGGLSRDHLILASMTLLAASALIWGYGRTQLIGLGALGLALFLIHGRLVKLQDKRGDEKRSLAAELAGVLLLTLSSPAVWISQRGSLDGSGLKVWLLNTLFFAGGVLYVKYRVRGLLAHRKFESFRQRAAFAWPVFVYHLLLIVFLLALISVQSLSMGALVAFAPGIFRANSLLFQLGEKFPIKRLGWTEVGHAVVFAGLLLVAFR